MSNLYKFFEAPWEEDLATNPKGVEYARMGFFHAYEFAKQKGFLTLLEFEFDKKGNTKCVSIMDLKMAKLKNET